MLAHAVHVAIAELVLDVDEPEHALQQVGPELGQHGLKVDGRSAADVVPRQVLEELLEELRVLDVHHAVGSYKHAVEGVLGVFQKLPEKLCREKRKRGISDE